MIYNFTVPYYPSWPYFDAGLIKISVIIILGHEYCYSFIVMESAIIFFQYFVENRIAIWDLAKQGHAGFKFPIVGHAENFQGRFSLLGKDRF